MSRAFDVVIASALLVVSLPVFLLVALAVKLTSRGPVVFGHTRCGLGGTDFQCLKFRTMVEDAEDWLERDPELSEAHRRNGFKLPLKSDPRVTPVGRLLRFTHLDELPQFFNVLKGDMSLVGPRPIVDEELRWYGHRTEALLSVRPGIFGFWTAQGKRRAQYPERVEIELEYVTKGTLLGDLKLLLRHVPILLSGQREEGRSEAPEEDVRAQVVASSEAGGRANRVA